MPNKKILIIDDDSDICDLLKWHLEREQYEVFICHDGNDAIKKFKTINPDLALLDIMLSGIDGWQVCSEVRKYSDVPIIMLTSKSEPFDKVLGLQIGADDYIVKPPDMREVLARITAIFRRVTRQNNSSIKDSRIVEYENLSVNMTRYEIRVKGDIVDCPPKEIELLFFLASNPNRVYSRDQLLDEVWGFEYYGDSRTIDVHIKRLREKIDNASEKWNLKTVWGIGYKFEAEQS